MKTYWNHEGKFNTEYEEMLSAKFTFTKAEENAMHKYYRYYNDGDMPVGSAYYPLFNVERYLEYQANVAVAKAYKRFKGNDVSNVIKYFAKKPLVGFKAYMGAQIN